MAKEKLTKKALWESYGYSRPPSPRYTSPEEKGIAWEAVRRYRALEEGCYTCPKMHMEPKDTNTGHYKPVALVGSNNTKSWDSRFIHKQCSYCNGAGQGMAVEYRRHLVLDYGEEVVADFDSTYRQVSPIKNWAAIIQHYETLLISWEAYLYRHH